MTTQSDSASARSSYTGIRELPRDFLDTHKIDRVQSNGGATLRVTGDQCSQFVLNQGLFQEQDGGTCLLLSVQEVAGDTAVLRVVPDYRNPQFSFLGIRALNIGQVFFIDALLNPNMQLVIADGYFGTGKSVLALTIGLHLALGGASTIKKVVVVRNPVSLGRPIGFLPGDVDKKTMPWMGSILDNLPLLKIAGKSASPGNRHSKSRRGNRGGGQNQHDPLKGVLELRPTAFMEGSSLHEMILIVEEAQLVSPDDMEVLLTRSAEGSRIVLLGNNRRNLNAMGLARAKRVVCGCPDAAQFTLERCVRSRMADWINRHWEEVE